MKKIHYRKGSKSLKNDKIMSFFFKFFGSGSATLLFRQGDSFAYNEKSVVMDESTFLKKGNKICPALG
jgi:hypothetical protein